MRPSTSWRRVPASNGMPCWSSNSSAWSRKLAPTPSRRRVRPVSRQGRLFDGGANQALDDHAVHPFAIQLAVPAIDADLAETERRAEAPARHILRKDA